jgi:membrane protease YdiL (CAAX protease family)
MQHPFLLVLLQDLATTPAPEAGSMDLRSALVLLAIGTVALQVAWRLVGDWFPPQPKPVAPISLWHVAEVLVVFFIAGLLASLLTGGAKESATPAATEPPVDITRAVLVQMLANAVAGAYAIWITRRSGGHWRDLGFQAPSLAKSLVFAVALYVAFLPIVLGCEGAWEAIAPRITGHVPDTQRIVKEFSERYEVRSNLVFVVAIGLIVPFLEELLFRGFLYTVLRRQLSAAAAITIDAILFGVTHDAGITAVILLGALLAFVFERTRSLVACTLVHALHNSYTLFLLFLGQQGA